MSETGPFLSIEGLNVHFGRRRGKRQIIRSAGLGVDAGEIVGLIGESGSGKSTIARAVLGLVRASGGSIRVGGEEVTTFSRSRWRDFWRRGVVQYVFQDPLRSLDADLVIADSIAEPLRIRGGLARAEIDEAVRRFAATVRLDESLLSRHPGELSGGQRQRAAIARALTTRPRLIILDEPVSALDAASRVQVLASLTGLRTAGVGLLYISHDLGSVAGITDRTVVLYQGSVVEHGPTAELVNEPRHPYTRLLVGSAPTLSGTSLDRLERHRLRAELGLDAPSDRPG
ncbi:putative peptide import ATP-binding protein BOV_A0347 [Frankia sp. AiPs1]|nr:ABC transporter ATP-binding protein [Frankia sp. AiPa1]MCL9760310.1 ATP-binding cassette domain-containing protein [Frankia sp. AiPa1]